MIFKYLNEVLVTQLCLPKSGNPSNPRDVRVEVRSCLARMFLHYGARVLVLS
jgi:hypothetical protein